MKMWWFKKSVVNPIPSNACWGLLVGQHKIDVDTLTNVMRCVVKEGIVNDRKVTFVRIFDLREIEKRKITITGWETFDQYPELLAFEGYFTEANYAFLERKNF